MSHPFVEGSNDRWKGWKWNGKACYIQTKMDQSVRHHQACGEAIAHWNEAVGERFLMVPDEGDLSITFFERDPGEPPFDQNPTAAALAFNSGQEHSDLYVLRSELLTHRQYVNLYAHEIGHAFGLADHTGEDINSVMSYATEGRWLLGPSFEDVRSIANLHGLKNMRVRPRDLDGSENIVRMWHWDRYENKGWSFYANYLTPGLGTIELKPYEVYSVLAKREQLLGNGRQALQLLRGMNRWAYL